MRIFLFTLLLFISLPVVLVWQSLQSYPLVTTGAPAQLQNADEVNGLLSQLKRALQDKREPHEFVLSEPQLESLVGFVQRAVPNVKGAVAVEEQGAQLQLTMSLPSFLTGQYLNVQVGLLPDKQLALSDLKVGNLSIPGNWLVGLAAWSVNHYTDSEIGSHAVEHITAVSMDEQEIYVLVAPVYDIIEELKLVMDSIEYEPTQEEQLTAYYMALLSTHALSLSPQPQSLLSYLQVMIAKVPSSLNEQEQQLHYRAIVYALATYAGDHRVGALVGDVQPHQDRIAKPAAPITLVNRDDLAKHFIISAALQMMSEQGITLAIGEFKELMDRARGRTGYSFVDLAADMAGIEFGKAASEGSAALFYQVVKGAPDETYIMPDIYQLPEGLSKAQFNRIYGSVDSDAYLEQVADIRRRIAQVPLYAKASL